MLAYHNDPQIKLDILQQLAEHRAADQIIKGYYWENGKGCAIGCTIHSSDHAEYETRFGIPRILAQIEDSIFEGLPNSYAKDWPERFMAAISPGSDLSMVWPKFAAWLLTDPSQGVIRFAKTAQQRDVMEQIAAFYLKGEKDREMWRKVWLKAREIRATYADADAASAAADAASAAADADAAAAAYAADAAAYAADAARSKHFVAESNKLIELLKAA